MIDARLHKNKGRVTAFELSGHSGYAEVGADIVCAAASTAAQFAILGIEETEKISCEYAVFDGGIEFSLSDNVTAREDEIAQSYLKTLEVFLVQLSQQYENYLKITVMEE